MDSIEYPEVKQIDSNVWKLTKDLKVYVEFTNSIIEVPEGFTTDFASIPRVLWGILPPFGKYTSAAVIHDYLYKNPTLLHPKILREMDLTRHECDAIFEELLIKSTCKKWKRIAMYWGVVLGGWWAWRKHRKNDEAYFNSL